jgi:high-affinity iron transporter
MNVTFIFRRWLLISSFLAAFFVSAIVAADPGDAPEVEARRLIHILGYTASDYAGAVQNGAVNNDSEYAEQKALLSDAQKIASRIEPLAPKHDAPFVADVAKLAELVDHKASDKDIGALVTRIRGEIVAAFQLIEAPSAPPDPIRGKALFAEHCATCHGDSGHADTPRAGTLEPRPANFHDPKVADPLTPNRVESTVRFGINGTAMVPLAFIPEQDRWALAFYVLGLRHLETPATDSPAYTLAELAVRSDADLSNELRAAGVDVAHLPAILADLRRRAPYEARAAKGPLGVARAKLDRARVALRTHDAKAARGEVIDAYLEGIEPSEGAINAADPAITRALEDRFLALRAKIEANAPASEAEIELDGLLRELTRAEGALSAPAHEKSALSTVISSAGILLREGVEAALLVAALLGVAAQAGLGDKRRWVHFGWASALLLGAITWIVSSQIVELSGASRETIEGVTALLAAAVLFYVSYSLLAKKEVARWMRFLRAQVSPTRAAASLFLVAFLAAYREAFETVLFYRALLASNASSMAAIAGAVGGAVVLVVLVALYSRAGRFAPPQTFFRISSYLLYVLAIVFAGQGVAALQVTGVIAVHALRLPSVPPLGIYATVETCVAQGLLIALAIVGALYNREKAPAPAASQQPHAAP